MLHRAALQAIDARAAGDHAYLSRFEKEIERAWDQRRTMRAVTVTPSDSSRGPIDAGRHAASGDIASIPDQARGCGRTVAQIDNAPTRHVDNGQRPGRTGGEGQRDHPSARVGSERDGKARRRGGDAGRGVHEPRPGGVVGLEEGEQTVGHQVLGNRTGMGAVGIEVGAGPGQAVGARRVARRPTDRDPRRARALRPGRRCRRSSSCPRPRSALRSATSPRSPTHTRRARD